MTRFKGNRVSNPGVEQYYTKPSVAKHCIDLVHNTLDISHFNTILEPSAGDGAFFNQLPPNRIGIDIDPRCEGVTQCDFFDWEPSTGSILTIGNPPFGRSSKLAIEFFNRASQFSDAIAFIIPISWKYWKIQNKLPQDWKLISEIELPTFSFKKLGQSPGKRILEDNSININCVFQIWTKNTLNDLPSIRRIEPEATTHPDFTMHGYFVNGNNLTDGIEWDFLIRSWGGMPFAKSGPSPLSTGTIINNPHGLKSNWRMQYTAIKANNPRVEEILRSISIEEWWMSMGSMNTIGPQLIVEKYEKYK